MGDETGQAGNRDRIAAMERELLQLRADLQRADEERRVQASLLEQIGRMASIGFWSVDVATDAVTWSDEVFRIHDLEPGAPPTLEEAVAYYPPGASEQIQESLERMLADGSDYNPVLPLITAKGREIRVRAWGEQERDKNGEPLRIVGLFQDVTKEIAEKEQLEAREHRLSLAIEGARDGVWDWYPQSGVVNYSSGWKAILGYAADEIPNDLNEWASRVHPDDMEATSAEVQACLDPGGQDVYRSEFRMRHKDESWRWILARGGVMERDEQGRGTRLTGTHVDITDQVDLREELVRAKQGAESAARTKSEFLATMSHEIRTPMNGILGMAQLLLESSLSEEQREQARMIHRSGSSLLVILNDILDLSKLEAGKLLLEQRSFDIRQCVRETLELMKPTAREKRIDLQLLEDSALPHRLEGDAGRIRQLLLNLIGNALKFTSEGRVSVRIRCTQPGPEGESRLSVSVEDTGIGVPADKLESLFEAFSQADASTTRRFGGTGLGLTIAKNLVERMDGEIGCESEPGVGSRFWFELPLRVDTTPPEREAKPCEPPASIDLDVDVLVVEDNQVNQVVARKMLESLGCRVEIAEHGQHALDRLSSRPFDVVFMDCHMPVMDGYETTKAIRSGSLGAKVAEIPIVAMTANVLPEDREKCREVGMTDYLSKPVEMEDLIRATRQAMGSTPGQQVA